MIAREGSKYRLLELNIDVQESMTEIRYDLEKLCCFRGSVLSEGITIRFGGGD